MRVMNYGGIVLSIGVPDRHGQQADVVLGFESLDQYFDNRPFFGGIIGRCGNRIANGRFDLEGRTIQLSVNEPPNHLHGGYRGFHTVMWKMLPFERARSRGVILSYVSPDGEEGYPGMVRATVTYTLTDEDVWQVDYAATSDRATPVNLTQHSYFNLAGAGSVLGHHVQIVANRFLPTDSTQIPTGELAPVAGTPFDFSRMGAVVERVSARHPQVELAHGIDHTYVLDGEAGRLRLAAQVLEPVSGRRLEVRTSEPGLHFYTGNHLGGVAGKNRHVYGRWDGFCLETQRFPDAPNHPHFPAVILRPGEVYTSRTVFAFSVD